MTRITIITHAAFLLAIASFASSANGDLVLGIDVDNKAFSLSGSDSGNIGAFGPGGIAQWTTTFPGSGGGAAQSAAGDMFSVSVGAPSQSFGHDTELNISFSGITRFTLFTTLDGPATITGQNVFLDYSHFSDDAQARLESVIGQSLAPAVGGSLFGFASIAVVQVTSAVPEPNTFILLGLFGVSAASFRRRRFDSTTAS